MCVCGARAWMCGCVCVGATMGFPFSDASRYNIVLSWYSMENKEWHLCHSIESARYGELSLISYVYQNEVRHENYKKKKKKRKLSFSGRITRMSNRDRFRYLQKTGRNVTLLSCAASRIRNLVNSPETVNSGTFDSRSLLYHSPSDQSDPNHGCHEPTLLRTNGPVAARTYKRRSARPNKSHATTSRIELVTSNRTISAKNGLWDRWKILNWSQQVWF